MPQKVWAVGEEVLAADFNTYVQNQSVPAFTSTTQRDSQWTSPPNGAMCVTTDTGTQWQRIAGTWYEPYSELGFATKGTDTTGITTALVVILTVAFTVPASRRVGMRAGVNLYKGGSDTPAIASVYLFMDGVNMVGRNVNIATSANYSASVEWRQTLAAGAHTATLQVNNTASFLNVGSNPTLTVDDVGAT